MGSIPSKDSSVNIKESYYLNKNTDREIIKKELIRVLGLKKNQLLYKWMDADTVDVK